MIYPAFNLTVIMRIICQYCLEKLRSGLSLNIHTQVTSQVLVRCFNKRTGTNRRLGNFHPFNRQGLIAAVFQRSANIPIDKLYIIILYISYG